MQFREVQGHESDQLQAVFKRDDGLRVCASACEPRLFECKGRRNILLTQVETKSASLNEEGVFILDCKHTLFCWAGKEADKYEKLKSMEVANKVKDEEREGKTKIVILDSGSDEVPEAEEFWNALGSRTAVKSAPAEGGSGSGKKKKKKRKMKPTTLVKVKYEKGKVKFKNVKVTTRSKKLEKMMLKFDRVFIVDVGHKVYVWIGQCADEKEKEEAIKFATKYLKDKKYPDWTPIERINERHEPPHFKDLFFIWNQRRRYVRTIDGKSLNQDYLKPKEVADENLFNICTDAEEKILDSNPKVEQWRIENNKNNLKKVEVPDNSKGQFFDEESYIVLYTHMNDGKEAHVIYFWQGDKSSTDEKAASALLSKQIDEDLSDAPVVQAFVTQGHEPKNFMAIFGGHIIIRRGKNRNDREKKYDTDGTKMYAINTTNNNNNKINYNNNNQQQQQLIASRCSLLRLH